MVMNAFKGPVCVCVCVCVCVYVCPYVRMGNSWNLKPSNIEGLD